MVQAVNTFTGAYGYAFELKISVDQLSQNITANTSVVRVAVDYRSKDSYSSVTWYGTGKLLTVEVNGQRETLTVDPNLTANQTRRIFSKEYVIAHNQDGSKTVGAYAQFDVNIPNIGSANVRATLSLHTIPRGSTTTPVRSTLNQPVTIRITKAVDRFRHTVRYQFGSASGTIATKIDTQTTWTPPLELARQMTTSTSKTGAIFIDTYDGDRLLSNRSFDLTLTVPGTLIPNATSIAVTEQNSAVYNVMGASGHIQNISDIICRISGASGQYGANIVQKTVTINGVTKEEGQARFILNQAGAVRITANLIDSRGLSRTITKDITVYPYSLPNIIAFMPARTGDGTNTAVQSDLLLNASKIMVGTVNKNPYKVIVERSERNKNIWSKMYESDVSSGQFSQRVSLGTGYEQTKAYDLRLTIRDKFNNQQVSMVTLGTIKVVMALGKQNVGIGMVPTVPVGIQAKGFYGEDGQSIIPYELMNKKGGALSLGGDEMDFNTKYQTGIYWMSAQSKNNPFGQWGLLECFNVRGFGAPDNANNEMIQRFTTSSGYMVIRERTHGDGTWRPWRYVAHTTHNTANTDFFTHGSNANGNYIKWSDGTLICYGVKRFKHIGRWKQETFVLPHRFKDTEYYWQAWDSAPHTADGAYVDLIGNRATNLENFVVRYRTLENWTREISREFRYFAIGRWK